MLGAFGVDVERRIAGVEHLTRAGLSALAHSLVAAAGQFGFLELSQLCALIEDEGRQGFDVERIAELRGVAGRAVVASKTCDFARAA